MKNHYIASVLLSVIVSCSLSAAQAVLAEEDAKNLINQITYSYLNHFNWPSSHELRDEALFFKSNPQYFEKISAELANAAGDIINKAEKIAKEPNPSNRELEAAASSLLYLHMLLLFGNDSDKARFLHAFGDSYVKVIQRYFGSEHSVLGSEAKTYGRIITDLDKATESTKYIIQ